MDRIIEKKQWPIKRVLLFIFLVLAVMVVLYLLIFQSKTSKISIDKNAVQITEVKRTGFQEYIPVDGVVLPRTTIFLNAVMGGTVKKIFVEDGEMLSMGDTIVKLDNASMELSFMEQETRIFEAINNLENTQINLEKNTLLRQQEIINIKYRIDQTTKNFNRMKYLYQDSLISQVEYEDAERDYRMNLEQLKISLELKRVDSLSTFKRTAQNNATMGRLKGNLELLRQSYDNLYIKAPAGGILSSFNLQSGQTMSQGEHIGQIDVPSDGFMVRADIDERYLSRITVGLEATFEYENQQYIMEVRKIYSDVTNRTFQVDLYFRNQAPEYLKRGQTLRMRINFSGADDALIIKRGNFYQETGGQWIYVLDQSGDFAVKRNIRLGRQNIREYEILDGLEMGEKVIISGYQNLFDRDKIIFKNN
ncbi:MAG: hypothetical protein C0593_04150 [Marinilabiliales bacterium]|nr:MAG: hypothetical protein C0593_04150 [Marinilabiliales bacterium]